MPENYQNIRGLQYFLKNRKPYQKKDRYFDTGQWYIFCFNNATKFRFYQAVSFLFQNCGHA